MSTSNTAAPKDDGDLALIILFVTGVVVVVVGLYLWKTNRFAGDKKFKGNAFTPPVERENYIDARETADLADPGAVEELKKLLIRRAIRTIPILLNLQNEGSSVDRLYKRGMLTDDMHFKMKELKSFVDQEFQEVQTEAEELVEGWGAQIWPQAMQFHQVSHCTFTSGCLTLFVLF